MAASLTHRACGLFTPASAIARYDIRGTPFPRSRQPLKCHHGLLPNSSQTVDGCFGQQGPASCSLLSVLPFVPSSPLSPDRPPVFPERRSRPRRGNLVSRESPDSVWSFERGGAEEQSRTLRDPSRRIGWSRKGGNRLYIRSVASVEGYQTCHQVNAPKSRCRSSCPHRPK